MKQQVNFCRLIRIDSDLVNVIQLQEEHSDGHKAIIFESSERLC